MPPFHFPFPYNYYNRYNRPSSYNSTNNNSNYTSYENKQSNSKGVSNENINNFQDTSTSRANPSNDISYENYFFELFGLKLYYDDILLMCLLFFLYNEGVQDDELFISLILLLLS